MTLKSKQYPPLPCLGPPTKSAGFHLNTRTLANAVVRNTSSVCFFVRFYVAQWYVISLHFAWAERGETNLLITKQVNPADKYPGTGTYAAGNLWFLQEPTEHLLAAERNSTAQVTLAQPRQLGSKDCNLRHTMRNPSNSPD